MRTTPSYRCRKGDSQAVVTLTDSSTKHRRDYWLGRYDTPESRELYHRLIAEWEANGRRLPDGDFQQVETGVIVRGHTRWKAARKLGLEQASVHAVRET